MTILRLLLFLLLLNLQVNTTRADTWIKASYLFAGSDFSVADVNFDLFTHLICAFAYINTSTYVLSLSPYDQFTSMFASSVKRNNPSVIPLLSIRALDDQNAESTSSDFFKMVGQPSTRKSFIESSIRVAKLYEFEELDLLLAGIDDEMSNLGTLFDEWRVAIDSESAQPKLLLTLAGHYSPVLDSGVSYPVDSVRRNFDWVNVLSYDYHMPLDENVTGAHAALYDPFSPVNTDYGINEWITRRLPVNKMLLGLPYHGYAWTLMDPKDNGIGAPAKGVAITSDGSVGYQYIKSNLSCNGMDQCTT